MQNESSAKKRVLIIDDFAGIVLACEIELKRLGMEPVNPGPVTSAKQAFDLVIQHGPDVDFILLDMNYGSEARLGSSADGCKVAMNIRDEQIRKKIICTSSDPAVYEKILRNLGVEHFGGKYDYAACLLGSCNCNKTAG